MKRGTGSDEWDFKTDDLKVVRFVTAPGTGKDVRLLRITPYQNKYTTFQEGSLLTSGQLNDGEDFSMLVDQELYDNTLKLKDEGKVSADLITTSSRLTAAPPGLVLTTKSPLLALSRSVTTTSSQRQRRLALIIRTAFSGSRTTRTRRCTSGLVAPGPRSPQAARQPEQGDLCRC